MSAYIDERCAQPPRAARLLYRVRAYRDAGGELGLEVQIKCRHCGEVAARRYLPSRMLRAAPAPSRVVIHTTLSATAPTEAADETHGA